MLAFDWFQSTIFTFISGSLFYLIKLLYDLIPAMEKKSKMIIQPKIRGFICTAAHPLGCFKAVQAQVDYVKAQAFHSGPQHVLIIGASTGYGLASRIVAAFGAKAATVGVSLERPADGRRTASAGWYNTAAFEKLALQEGYIAKSINGDAFSTGVKEETIDWIKKSHHLIDLIIYSLASPRRIHPQTGEVFNSVLKPIGNSYHSKTVDPFTGVVKDITIEAASDAEIIATDAVMGGEDWSLWINTLLDEGLLAKNAKTLAYSYIGPSVTHPIYKNGTIGHAKHHLYLTAKKLDQQLQSIGGRALISVNKALVTQASSAIPVVPLYISLLYKLMKEQGTHEGCIEQMQRLFCQRLYTKEGPIIDEKGYIRMDDWEMDFAIQKKIEEIWPKINNENLNYLVDLNGYINDFYNLFGFNIAGIDYAAEVEAELSIPSIEKIKEGSL